MNKGAICKTNDPSNLAQNENRHGSFGTVAPNYARSSTQVNIFIKKNIVINSLLMVHCSLNSLFFSQGPQNEGSLLEMLCENAFRVQRRLDELTDEVKVLSKKVNSRYQEVNDQNQEVQEHGQRAEGLRKKRFPLNLPIKLDDYKVHTNDA